MKVDIAIITIRGDEFTAVRKRIKTKRHQIPHGRTYLIGEVRTGKQRYTIAIARCMEQGTDAAQRLAHDIIHDLDPQLILVVGIAGGVPHDEFTLGDVVVSTRIVNPNVDALHPDGTTDYTTRGGPPHPLVENIVSLLPGDPQMVGWTDSIQYERPTLDPEQANITGGNGWCEKVSASLNKHFGEADKQSRSPIFTIGHVLSSNHLMKDPVRLSEILKTHRSILAVEMEVAGVYEAAQGMDHQYPVMAIRGISDIVGLQRNSKWTEYACQTAAAFTYAFIMTDPLDLPPKSVRSQTPVAPSEISPTQARDLESSIYPQPSVWHSNFNLRGQYVNGPQFNAENIFNQTPSFAHFIDSETLEAAQQKFAQLPLDTIPEVAPLPAGSFMPFSRNPLFVGHEGDLQVLAKMLKGGEVAVIGQTGIAAATGMGGIGKTQLASEFVHRYGQYFPGGVIWLNFSDEINIQTEIAKCCAFGCLGIQIAHDNISLEERIRLVLSSWQSPIPRLLIFDNCEDEALLEQWRPHTGGSHILITSLRPNWNLELGVKVLKMNVLSRVESVELLCKSRKNLSRENSALGEIADELGYLPLALHLAGSFLSKYSHTSFGTPVSYLARLRQTSPLVDPSLQVEGRTISTGHIKSLKQTFHIAFERLKTNDEVDVLARKLLARAVYFAPNVPSPDYILHLSVIEDTSNIASMELLIEDALDRLITLGLLERLENGLLRLHRLIKEVARITMEEEESTEAQKAVEMALYRYATYSNEKDSYSELLTLQPHLYNIINLNGQRKDSNVVKLHGALGISLLKEGRYSEAQSSFEKAYELYKQMSISDAEGLVSVLNSLAVIYNLQGNYHQSEQLARESLNFCEQTFTSEHIFVSDALNNLAHAFYQQGNYLESEQLVERSLRIRIRQYGGTNHPDVAYNYAYLAKINVAKKQYTEAISYYQKALNIRKRTLGENHISVADCVHGLAEIYRIQGELQKAKQYYNDALEIRRQNLKSNHPEIAENLNGLAVCSVQQGEFAEAESLFEQALEILEPLLKTDHPQITQIQDNLVDCLMKQGKFESAENLAQKIVETLEQALGPENIELALHLQKLADVCYARKSYRKAESTLKQALVIFKHIEGANGQNYIKCINQYNIVLRKIPRRE